jgi:CheY-like chemotaxis protein
MNRIEQLSTEDIYGSRIKSFQKLMRFKVRDILLVASLYDQYLFEEDGRLYELIRQEFQVLNLSHPPEITHVTSGEEAIELLTSGENFDLVITTLHIEDMPVIRFAQKVRQTGIDIPMILLAYDNREKKEIITNYDTSVFDRIFIWHGDYRLLVAMIKYVEDKLNVQNDTAMIGVQVIILVEDDISFYSSYFSTRKFSINRSGLFQKASILRINSSDYAHGRRYYYVRHMKKHGRTSKSMKSTCSVLFLISTFSIMA